MSATKYHILSDSINLSLVSVANAGSSRLITILPSLHMIEGSLFIVLIHFNCCICCKK